jgi:hypothetical protein
MKQQRGWTWGAASHGAVFVYRTLSHAAVRHQYRLRARARQARRLRCRVDGGTALATQPAGQASRSAVGGEACACACASASACACVAAGTGGGRATRRAVSTRRPSRRRWTVVAASQPGAPGVLERIALGQVVNHVRRLPTPRRLSQQPAGVRRAWAATRRRSESGGERRAAARARACSVHCAVKVCSVLAADCRSGCWVLVWLLGAGCWRLAVGDWRRAAGEALRSVGERALLAAGVRAHCRGARGQSSGVLRPTRSWAWRQHEAFVDRGASVATGHLVWAVGGPGFQRCSQRPRACPPFNIAPSAARFVGPVRGGCYGLCHYCPLYTQLHPPRLHQPARSLPTVAPGAHHHHLHRSTAHHHPPPAPTPSRTPTRTPLAAIVLHVRRRPVAARRLIVEPAPDRPDATASTSTKADAPAHL